MIASFDTVALSLDAQSGILHGFMPGKGQIPARMDSRDGSQPRRSACVRLHDRGRRSASRCKAYKVYHQIGRYVSEFAAVTVAVHQAETYVLSSSFEFTAQCTLCLRLHHQGEKRAIFDYAVGSCENDRIRQNSKALAFFFREIAKPVIRGRM